VLQPNGSFSPTGIKLKATGDLLRRELELIESGEAPYDKYALKNMLFVELGTQGMSHAKSSQTCSNAARRIMNAFCYWKEVPLTTWSIVQTNNALSKLNIREYCELLKQAINLPAEACADIKSP